MKNLFLIILIFLATSVSGEEDITYTLYLKWAEKYSAYFQNPKTSYTKIKDTCTRKEDCNDPTMCCMIAGLKEDGTEN